MTPFLSNLMTQWNSFRQQETTAFGRGGMRHRVTGMSPHMGVGEGTTGFARGAPFSRE
jgi:hypothetical protein